MIDGSTVTIFWTCPLHWRAEKGRALMKVNPFVEHINGYWLLKKIGRREEQQWRIISHSGTKGEERQCWHVTSQWDWRRRMPMLGCNNFRAPTRLSSPGLSITRRDPMVPWDCMVGRQEDCKDCFCFLFTSPSVTHFTSTIRSTLPILLLQSPASNAKYDNRILLPSVQKDVPFKEMISFKLITFHFHIYSGWESLHVME